MPSLVSVIVVALVTLFYLISEGISNVSYIGLALLNTIIMGWAMFSKPDKPFTLHKIVNLFAFIFFVVANGVQFARHTDVLTFRMYLSPEDYVNFQLLVFLIFAVFNFMYMNWWPHYSRRARITPPDHYVNMLVTSKLSQSNHGCL